LGSERNTHPHPLRRRPRPKPGTPPGTLIKTESSEPSRATLWSWGGGIFQEKTLSDLKSLDVSFGSTPFIWLDITGIPDSEAIARVGGVFGLHPLSLEDVLGPGQRPKIETYDNYVFIVLKEISADRHVEESPISIFLGNRFVVTLQESSLQVLEPLRERLRGGRGQIRSRGTDYLAYAIIDSTIDHYFPVLEELDDRIEGAEAAVLESRSSNVLHMIRGIRIDLRMIRHATRPLRDVLASMLHEDVPFVSDDTRLYLRDSYDHIAQLEEMGESSREVAASLLETYVSTVSLETNQVIRVLTLIATIFIPLTFITGVYGMNFNTQVSPINMPELNWYWGYAFSLTLMIATTILMLLFFRRKGWLSRDRKRPSSPTKTDRE
jgi:magnesium transporter